MIRYQLSCAEDHAFEAWFASSSAYDDQAKRNLVSCPHCGSTKVSKALMAPNIARGVGSDKAQREIVEMVRHARDHVMKLSENVGDKFADEARKIHRDETKPRSIYGSATVDEAESLKDEGVEFHPLPVLPEDHN